MPGNILAPDPTGVFPKHLSTKYSEKRTFAQLQSHFHDGNILRSQLALASRKSFSLTQKLTAPEVATLKAFYDSHLGGLIPFWFYNFAEGVPVGSNYDPTGSDPTGRYAVVFRNDWQQQTGLVRTFSPNMELIEVAGGGGFLGGSIDNPVIPTPGVTLIVRPTMGVLAPTGLNPCSGIGSISTSPTDATGNIERWCFSGLGNFVGGTFSGFIVPYPTLLVSAILTVASHGGKKTSGSEPGPGVPGSPTASTYDAGFDCAFDGIGQSYGVVVAAGPATYSSTVNVDLVTRSVNIQTCNWLALTVTFAVVGFTSSAFDVWAGNQMTVDDVYLTLNY